MTHQEEFVKKYYQFAKESERDTQVPALVTLVQAAIESFYGAKAPGNMFFGIKADSSWKGEKQLIRTTEIHKTGTVKYPVILSITRQPNGLFRYDVKDYFRAYNTAKESFNDHGKFLRSNPRYASAFLTTDPVEFARRIAAAGYATGPTYFQLMEQLIKKFTEIIKGNNL